MVEECENVIENRHEGRWYLNRSAEGIVLTPESIEIPGAN